MTLENTPWSNNQLKYPDTNGKLAARHANAAIMMKLALNIVLIFLFGIFSEDPKKYPNDINPKNVPIIILVITALDPTQNANWRKTINSKDKLIYPFRNIKNINQKRNFLLMNFSLLIGDASKKLFLIQV